MRLCTASVSDYCINNKALVLALISFVNLQMGVNSTDLEGRIRECIAVEHLEIRHEPSGCGDTYSVIIVSQVCSNLRRPDS